MGACANKMEEEQPNRTNRSETESSTPTANGAEEATSSAPVEVQEEVVIQKKVRQKVSDAASVCLFMPALSAKVVLLLTGIIWSFQRAVFAPGAFPVDCPEGYARDRNGRCRKIE